MNKPQDKDVYLQRIKRKTNSWDGKVIDYLSSHPSNKPVTELSMEAITSFWLPEALEGTVTQEELTKACRSAIEKLEGKLVTIRNIAGIDKLPTSDLNTDVVSSDTISNDERQIKLKKEDDEDDEDWDVESELMQMEQPEELRDANRLLGYE